MLFPKDVWRLLAIKNLNVKDIGRLSLVCRETHHALRQDLRQLKCNKLLQHIAFGEEAQAEAMLKDDSDLLFMKGFLHDYSGRVFKNITPMQMAAWALDMQMLHVINRYIPDDRRDEVRQQLEAHNDHYDFRELLLAYDYFMHHPARFEIMNHVIGAAQRNVPAWVANLYCTQTIRFKDSQKLEGLKYDRTLQCHARERYNRNPGRFLPLYSYRPVKSSTWFPLETNAGLGVDFAVCKGSMKYTNTGTDQQTNPLLPLQIEQDAAFMRRIRAHVLAEFEVFKGNILLSAPAEPTPDPSCWPL